MPTSPTASDSPIAESIIADKRRQVIYLGIVRKHQRIFQYPADSSRTIAKSDKEIPSVRQAPRGRLLCRHSSRTSSEWHSVLSTQTEAAPQCCPTSSSRCAYTFSNLLKLASTSCHALTSHIDAFFAQFFDIMKGSYIEGAHTNHTRHHL